LKSIFNLNSTPKNLWERRTGKKMTNSSEKAVTAMTFFQFEKLFPDEKAAIDYFLEIRYRGNFTEFSFRQNTRLDKNMFNVLLCQCILV
jgi:hypothetical protein